MHLGPNGIAAMKDVPITSREEEFVLDTVQRQRNIIAATKVVPVELSMEEYVLNMVQRPRLADMMVVQSSLEGKRECVSNTEQSERYTFAAKKDVPIKL